MKRIIIFILFCYCIPASLIAQTSIETKTPNPVSHKLKKLLVLSMSRNYEDRKTTENEIVWWLKHKGFRAVACNRLMNSDEIPPAQAINEIVSQNEIDGVLISDVTDEQMKERYESNQQQYNYNPNRPKFYNFLDTYKNAYNMGYNYNTKSFIVDSRLFDVKTEDIVFEAHSSTYESINLDKAIESYAKSLSAALKRSRILEKTVNGKK